VDIKKRFKWQGNDQNGLKQGLLREFLKQVKRQNGRGEAQAKMGG